MISSAKVSAIDLIDLKALSLQPFTMKYIAKLTLLNGATSTAYFLTTPAVPILVESSLGPAF